MGFNSSRSHSTPIDLSGLQVLEHGVPSYLLLPAGQRHGARIRRRRPIPNLDPTTTISISDHEPALLHPNQSLLPLQHPPLPPRPDADRLRHDHDRGPVDPGEGEGAEVPGQALLGPGDGGHEPGDGARGGSTGLGLVGELEDLEAVLGDGDAHAEEELVVEVGDVLLLELVVGEEEGVVVGQRRLEPRFR